MYQVTVLTRLMESEGKPVNYRWVQQGTLKEVETSVMGPQQLRIPGNDEITYISRDAIALINIKKATEEERLTED